MNRGDVWWVSFDPSVGGEIKKTRPAVIMSNNAANAALNRVVVVPLSSRVKKLYPAEALVTVAGKPGKAMADQIMTVSKTRLLSKMAILSSAELRVVEQAILQHLAIFRPMNGKL